MTSDRKFEQRIAEYFSGEAYLRAPDRVLQSALASIEALHSGVRSVSGRLARRGGNQP
jgi:hypothetical protein